MRHKWRRSRVQAQHNIQALLEQAFIVAHDAAAAAPSDPRHDTYADVAVVVEAMLRALESDHDHAKFGKLVTTAREVIKKHSATFTITGDARTHVVGPSISNRTDDLKEVVRYTAIFDIAQKMGRGAMGGGAMTKAEQASWSKRAEGLVFDIGWFIQCHPHSFGTSTTGDYHKACAAIQGEMEKALNRTGCSAKTLAIAVLVGWGINRRRATDLLRHAEEWTSG